QPPALQQDPLRLRQPLRRGHFGPHHHPAGHRAPQGDGILGPDQGQDGELFGVEGRVDPDEVDAVHQGGEAHGVADGGAGGGEVGAGGGGVEGGLGGRGGGGGGGG